MNEIYVLKSIYDFLNRFYGLQIKITKVETSHYYFDLGCLGAFILNTNEFKSDADLNAFTVILSSRLNTALATA